MQTETQKPITKSYTIPLDLLIDILKILLNSNIGYHIEAINETESSLLVQVSFSPTVPNHSRAKENIETLLNDYGYFLYGSPVE